MWIKGILGHTTGMSKAELHSIQGIALEIWTYKYMYYKQLHIILTLASIYSTLLSKWVSFSFSVASLDLHDVSKTI